MIGVTAVVILALVGYSLKSVVIPLRSLLGIALTLSFAYGSATVVYQYGWLDWLGFWGLHSYEHEQSILWMPPLVSFSICVGLMLDYDVLLLIRVADLRYSVRLLLSLIIV
jgi:RND superfamily putative drug exporter